MKGNISLEEHFATEEFLEDVKPYFIREGTWKSARDTIVDISGKRLELMEQAGIEKTILSLSSPAIQGILEVDKAIDAAKRINEYIASQIKDHTDRFSAFASIPTQDPDAAIMELRRAVNDYGFKGALINGFCQIGSVENIVYLDDPRYLPFWEEVQKLDVPIYIHPRPTIPAIVKAEYEGHYWMQNAAWGWHTQAGTHCLRLMGSGLFDKFPDLKIVIGHMDELLPYIHMENYKQSKQPQT